MSSHARRFSAESRDLALALGFDLRRVARSFERFCSLYHTRTSVGALLLRVLCAGVGTPEPYLTVLTFENQKRITRNSFQSMSNRFEDIFEKKSFVDLCALCSLVVGVVFRETMKQ